VVARRWGDYCDAEDAVQEALLAATLQWQADGVPDNPRGWLVRVAWRRLVDQARSAQARRRREELVVRRDTRGAMADDEPDTIHQDDTLILMVLCCHESLSTASAIALTLRAVGGLTTAEIAAAFLVPEATVAQRISRAKSTVRSSGAPFRMPGPKEWPGRLEAVLHVLYLIFTEGHTSTSGTALQRPDLAREALRLTRMLHAQLPDDPEVAGLLALMLLTDARAAARTSAEGALIPLADQDRTRWDARAITEGVALITDALPRGRVGPYQLQAAIAAVHDESPSAEETDWPQILALYGVLQRISDSPVVRLNRAVALAMVHGPQAGLLALAELDGDKRVADGHRLLAVRAHLLERAGELGGAIAAYRAAASRTTSTPERDYLRLRAAELAERLAGRSTDQA
jgi:RNA polymerase sigma factor (sigma-70 family)